MGILNSIFGKKKQDLFTPFWSAFGRSYGCGNLRISNKIYSEITLKSLVGHICNAVETIEVWDSNKTNEYDRLVAYLKQSAGILVIFLP